MSDPATLRRIPLPDQARPDRRVRRPFAEAALATAVILALAACGGGGDDAPGEGPEAPSAERGEEAPAAGPGDTDVWLGELIVEGDSVVVGELRNVTARPGYDNQPAFVPGGGLLYTAIDSTGQADVWQREPTGRLSRITDTSPESEYSPTPMPSGNGFSAVRVEADSTQRLWRFTWDGAAPALLFPDVAPVGYHAWAGEDRVAMFVLGDPPTLRVAGVGTGEVREVARDIGRSIQSIPGEDAVSFVQRIGGGASEEGDAAGGRAGGTRIMRWSEADGVTALTDAPDGGDFHAWTPDGLILMASGDGIVAWRQGWEGWRTVGALPGGGAISRLAVSPEGDRIAVVAEPARGS